VKWGGSFWRAEIQRSPLDVVAWHGNYAPYKYDLRKFSAVGPILFDHADPSIFTVLTSPSETPGTANIDFVIFSDRWLAKTGGGFVPGGISLHNTLLPHGPDRDAFERASAAELRPHKLEGTLAFMFETRFAQQVTRFAAEATERQSDYGNYGRRLVKHFDPRRP
jgi:homogentisate 1,2-dioxygenase